MKAKNITMIGLFAALVFLFTFTFKVPEGGMLGYAHLGDMFIIISVWMLGRKYAPFAAGIGAAIADIASGFAVWALPTFVIKFVFAALIGLVAEKYGEGRFRGFLLGGLIGGVFHVAAYSVVWVVVGGIATAISALLPLAMQTLIGYVLGNIMVNRLEASKIGNRLKEMAQGGLE